VFITRIRHSRILPIPDILQAMGVAPHTPITAETETEDYNDENENEVIDGPNESSPSDDVKPLARIRELEVIFFASVISFPRTHYLLADGAPALTCTSRGSEALTCQVGTWGIATEKSRYRSY
jgi:hypothetical protein